MPFSDTYANTILNHMIGKASTTFPTHTTVYVGLCTNDPEEDGGTFNELSGGAYARVLISAKGEPYPDVMGTANNRSIANTKQINWVKSTADWPQAKGFGLFTVASGGTPFFYGKLEEPVTCESGSVALFDPNTLIIKFSAADEAVD